MMKYLPTANLLIKVFHGLTCFSIVPTEEATRVKTNIRSSINICNAQPNSTDVKSVSEFIDFVSTDPNHARDVVEKGTTDGTKGMSKEDVNFFKSVHPVNSDSASHIEEIVMNANLVLNGKMAKFNKALKTFSEIITTILGFAITIVPFFI